MKSKQTFSEIVTEFLEAKTLEDLKPKSIKNYHAELHLMELFFKRKRWDLTFENISIEQLNKWFAHLKETRNQGGLHANYRVIRCLFLWYENRFEPENWKNPIKKITIKSPNNKPLDEIPMTQVNELITACDMGLQPKRDKLILRLLVDTGLRASEMLSLDIRNVDHDTIFVEHGKRDKSRYVFIGLATQKALADYLLTRTNAKPNDPLILTDDGHRLSYNGLVNLLRRLTERIDSPDNPSDLFLPHSYRRLSALTLWRQTGNLNFVQRILGHESPEVTKKYLNISNEDLRERFSKASPGDLLE